MCEQVEIERKKEGALSGEEGENEYKENCIKNEGKEGATTMLKMETEQIELLSKCRYSPFKETFPTHLLVCIQSAASVIKVRYLSA